MRFIAGTLTARLANEFNDAALAATVAAAVPPEVIDTLGATLTPVQVSTIPTLAYLPEPTDDPVDTLVVLAFGNRVAADGTVTAGPTNEALATSVETWLAEHPTPVFAQWEVAEILRANGVPDVVSIEPQVAADGTVGVVGFADHLVRCVMTAERSGMTAVVVEGLELPTEYDPESGQEWTRDRASYLTVDLSSRLAAL